MKLGLLLVAAALCPGVQGIQESEYEAAIQMLEAQLQDVELRVKERNKKVAQANGLEEIVDERAKDVVDGNADLVEFSAWKTTWWPYIAGTFLLISLILLYGAIREGQGWPEDKATIWNSPARIISQYIRETDTLKQLCPYNPWTDPGQAPSPNPYRLVAIMGPWGTPAYEKENQAGFKWTLPSSAGYVGILLMTMLTFIMQMYFPWKLVTGKLHGTSFVFQGLKTVFYYQKNMSAVFLDLVPLSVMSAKFFVQVEDKVRSEFNQCLFLWRFTLKTDNSQAGDYKGIPHKAWSWFWIAVSLGINTYIAVLMTFYVVLSITTQSGDLMTFILSIFGSLGMIDFDDALLGALPEWTMWYQEHTNAGGHPQGGHWAGASADFFGGPESIKGTDDAFEGGGLRQEHLAEHGPEVCHSHSDEVEAKYLRHEAHPNEKSTGNYWKRPKFVKVGIQLTNERPALGFLYKGNTITMVSDSGAAARAVAMRTVEEARSTGNDKWDKSHEDDSQAGKSQKGNPGLGQPTEREGLKRVISTVDAEPFGSLPFGNYFGARFPFLYTGKDFDWFEVEYEMKDDAGYPSDIGQASGLVAFVKGDASIDIGSSPVVMGSVVKKMLERRPWQNFPKFKLNEIDDKKHYVLRGTGLEAGMCIWKINDRNVSTAEQIKEELRALKGNCLNADQKFDPSLEKKGKSHDKPGVEKFDAVPWNVKEFTMTLSVAGDEDSDLDDLFHSIIYAGIRIMLFGSLMFIFMVYVTDSKGNHVGI